LYFDFGHGNTCIFVESSKFKTGLNVYDISTMFNIYSVIEINDYVSGVTSYKKLPFSSLNRPGDSKKIIIIIIVSKMYSLRIGQPVTYPV